MKSYNVDDKLKDIEIIKRAIIKVCKSKRPKNKRKYNQAHHILKNIDAYVQQTLEMVTAFEKQNKIKETGGPVSNEIIKKAYAPRKCEPFTITDGSSKKQREITSVPLFPDQVIHQLIIEAAQPIFMKEMYAYSCGSVPGGGIHKGKRYIEKTIKHCRKYDKSEIKYVAQLDIKKCYPSVPHSYLKKQLKRKFRGKLFLWLVFAIIDSYYICKDGQRRGLPIGYSTSQWFCNFALTPLDNKIKGELKIKHYVRYMDDMVLFGRNKKKLHKVVRTIIKYLKNIGLTIKKNWQVYRFDYTDKDGRHKGRAIDFLGFRFFRNKIILRKRLALAIRRATKRISRKQKITTHDAMSIMSRLGWLRHCNSHNFYYKHIKPYINIKKLKEIIKRESRKQYYATIAI